MCRSLPLALVLLACDVPLDIPDRPVEDRSELDGQTYRGLAAREAALYGWEQRMGPYLPLTAECVDRVWDVEATYVSTAEVRESYCTGRHPSRAPTGCTTELNTPTPKVYVSWEVDSDRLAVHEFMHVLEYCLTGLDRGRPQRDASRGWQASNHKVGDIWAKEDSAMASGLGILPYLKR